MASTVPAVAAPYVEITQQVTVYYGDLDVDGSDGAAELYARLQSAARTVCGPYQRDFVVWRMQRKCYEKALWEAVDRVARPPVLALHLANSSNGKRG